VQKDAWQGKRISRDFAGMTDDGFGCLSTVIANAAKQSRNVFRGGSLDCFAALAMTGRA